MTIPGQTARSAAAHRNPRKPMDRTAAHYVYRAFDDLGVLLYIGCTNDVARRLAQHRSRGLWTQYLDHVETQGPYDRDEALQIEAAAIRAESPAFNAQREHVAMVQANRNVATDLLNSLPLAPLDDDAAADAWYEARNAIGVLIRRSYPVVDDDARLAAYLGCRARLAVTA